MIIRENVRVHLTAQGMVNAANVWRIIAIIMKVFQDVSFLKKPRPHMIEVLKLFTKIILKIEDNKKAALRWVAFLLSYDQQISNKAREGSRITYLSGFIILFHVISSE